MTTKTAVEFRISGPSLSFLLHDCECSKSDEMGFLIGEKSSITSQTVTDEEMEMKSINTTLTINGSYPIGLPFLFCNALGRVNEDVLKEVLGQLEKDVLGWYSFRRNCNHNISMRETYLHSELIKALHPVPPEYFIFGLVTATEADKSSTHSKRFTFFTQKRKRFHPISVIETNLGEVEDNCYKKSIITNGSSVDKVLSSINGKECSKNVSVMLSVHTRINKHVQKSQAIVTHLQGILVKNHPTPLLVNCAGGEHSSWNKDARLPTSSSKSGSRTANRSLSEEY